jgi:GTP-binding protein HflX
VGVEDLSYHRQPARSAATGNYFTLAESLAEMRSLVQTANMVAVGEVTQRLNEPNPRTHIGTGKVKEIAALCHSLECCCVVFDAELSPRQLKHLEQEFGGRDLNSDAPLIKILDRTALILDIFARRANTREAMLQIELALQTYRAPRLTKLWTHLERQSGAGGVGLRGPGERQLEIDKRLMRDRIGDLRKEIDAIAAHRNLQRNGRENLGLPVVSIVGYTNAGKSTLMNKLANSGIFVEDLLFATLDPTTRKVRLSDKSGDGAGSSSGGADKRTHVEVLLTDTVGFIQKLPTTLVAAFRATLEEMRSADLLLHVIDVSSPTWEKREQSVMDTLAEIGCANKPVVRVMNKIDAVAGQSTANVRALVLGDDTVGVSAATGEGLDDFVSVVKLALAKLLVDVEVVVPYDKGEEVNMINEVGTVDFVDYRPEGTHIKGKVPKAVVSRLARYSVVCRKEV